ncbi:MarC family protein [Undibacterium terreum]|uniref:UPF0056 membrane protein n=1 Tax=Undibacterium terreum TaxID=1224302 RepID=A0A916UYJ2_9BURK|nr:MarC family protein [Undibacterium terreum]GGC94118.1 hypothetical protein GCM10011396_46800 [Undibacterium terreum]
MNAHFFPVFVILLLVLNPLACTYALRQGTAGKSAGDAQWLILKTCGCSLCMLLAISILGQTVIRWFSLSTASVQVSSGLILFLLAVSMIFSGVRPVAQLSASTIGPDAFGAMLAYLAGPTAMANVLLLSATQTGHWPAMALALACAVAASAALMQLCYRLQHHFGFSMAASGIQKLMGLLLTAVAVDRILLGSQQYFSA